MTRQIQQVEQRIAALEGEQRELEAALADPSVLADHERVAAAGTRHREVEQELAWQLREWEQLQETAGG